MDQLMVCTENLNMCKHDIPEKHNLLRELAVIFIKIRPRINNWGGGSDTKSWSGFSVGRAVQLCGFNVGPWTGCVTLTAADTHCCPPRGINKELQHKQKTHLLMLGGGGALDTVSSSRCLPVFSPAGYELLSGLVLNTLVFVPLDEICCCKHTEAEYFTQTWRLCTYRWRGGLNVRVSSEKSSDSSQLV